MNNTAIVYRYVQELFDCGEAKGWCLDGDAISFSAGDTDIRWEGKGGLELVYCAGREKIVRIPSRVNGRRIKAVDADAFAGCTGIGKITLAEGITEVENDFCGAETVRLPNSYTSLGEDTPWGFCSEGFVRFALKSDHPYFIEEDGFIYDRSGETLIFAPRDIEVCRVKEGVRFIGERAFGCHPKLKAVFLPESLEKIGRLVFEGCKKLYLVQLPAGSDRLDIGEGAFSGCSQLEMLYSPGGMIPVPRTFYDERDCEGWKAHYTPAVPDAPEEMAKKIGELGFEEYDRLYWREPELKTPDWREVKKRAGEELAGLSDGELDELTARCVRLADELDL